MWHLITTPGRLCGPACGQVAAGGRNGAPEIAHARRLAPPPWVPPQGFCTLVKRPSAHPQCCEPPVSPELTSGSRGGRPAAGAGRSPGLQGQRNLAGSRALSPVPARPGPTGTGPCVPTQPPVQRSRRAAGRQRARAQRPADPDTSETSRELRPWTEQWQLHRRSCGACAPSRAQCGAMCPALPAMHACIWSLSLCYSTLLACHIDI